jgi:hypothetical protein
MLHTTPYKSKFQYKYIQERRYHDPEDQAIYEQSIERRKPKINDKESTVSRDTFTKLLKAFDLPPETTEKEYEKFKEELEKIEFAQKLQERGLPPETTEKEYNRITSRELMDRMFAERLKREGLPPNTTQTQYDSIKIHRGMRADIREGRRNIRLL